MDFTLSLTHFCEAHGPKNVLCTQVLPLECALCLPPSPPLRASSSTESLNTHVHDLEDPEQSIASLRRQDTNTTLPTNFSGASTTVDSEPDSPSIERHPYYKDLGTDAPPQYRYGRAQGETCASCTFSVPQPVASRLPAGAPGSIDTTTTTRTAPVFRSREFVCLGSAKSKQNITPSTSQGSASSLLGSFEAHHEGCHDHTLTYLTSKSPESATIFSTLRNSVVRTLSCELLPRGMSDGPLCFGDSVTGYTIAYSFRLSDPKARGRRRTYAFLALAGTDASRAFKACPLIWDCFASLAKVIEGMALRKQEEQRKKEEDEANRGKRNYTPVSSFLTQRQIDPDGTPRRAGLTTPRSLSEITGDENIFAILHRYFVALLKCLGDRFGGLQLAPGPSLYRGVADDGFTLRHLPKNVSSEAVKSAKKPENVLAERQTLSYAPTSQPNDDIDMIKKGLSKNLSLQCGPTSRQSVGQPQMVS